MKVGEYVRFSTCCPDLQDAQECGRNTYLGTNSSQWPRRTVAAAVAVLSVNI